MSRTLPARYAVGALVAILLLALGLRLHGIHDPILDHPNWRQGDTASIARNFAQRQYNILYPQTDYDGPPPNYVELELQVLPFFAATLYKVAGVHEIIGRLLAILFSLGTIVVLAAFARRLYDSDLAGVTAAAFFAVFPGSIYYGRTFTPDVVMVFFLTAALFSAFVFLERDERLAPRGLARVGALVTLAYLAKPVAVLGIVPLGAMMWDRVRARRAWRATAYAVLLLVPLFILYLYDRDVSAHAEWHWASGITRLHVLPALAQAFSSVHAFARKLDLFWGTFGLLRVTMLGTAGFAIAVASCIAIPWTHPRSPSLVWGWLVAGLVYAFVVVTVERVDYYLFVMLPFAALVIGGAIARIDALSSRWIAPAAAGALALATLLQGRGAVAHYYHYDRTAYADAVLVAKTIAPKTLVVMGHYGPDVLYYIDRFGWEEDPLLWTPFDEESAIRKGARYYISVEDNRLRKNLELCAWMSRFPVERIGTWPVYRTDPSLVTASATAFWNAFRTAERRGRGRNFLDARRVCVARNPSTPTGAAAASRPSPEPSPMGRRRLLRAGDMRRDAS
ncbi:MAG: ArnT family glycosyltransferase [Candidatus Tyrphobacter sp.]